MEAVRDTGKPTSGLPVIRQLDCFGKRHATSVYLFLETILACSGHTDPTNMLLLKHRTGIQPRFYRDVGGSVARGGATPRPFRLRRRLTSRPTTAHPVVCSHNSFDVAYRMTSGIWTTVGQCSVVLDLETGFEGCLCNAFTSALKNLDDPIPQFKATAKLGEAGQRPLPVSLKLLLLRLSER